ncbi:MAG: prepilin-type N-terminal cleavage/methylation domain-containing protein [Clostridiales bacterium]|jgi:type II secretory pathway pseudopilin PulG|nr:prepilin-type N-terminal cleavage/methylation domain-containing protein [Clostridiales bacterium]
MFDRNNEGYTLLESLVAVTVIMLVMTAALRLFSLASAATSRAAVRSELTEYARIAADVMSANIQQATEIKIELNANNTLKKLTLTLPSVTSKSVFVYYPDLEIGTVNYHRLIFTGNNVNNANVLASNLADIKIISESGNTLFIEILTDNKITNSGKSAIKNLNITVEPVFIRVPVNISGKTLLP